LVRGQRRGNHGTRGEYTDKSWSRSRAVKMGRDERGQQGKTTLTIPPEKRRAKGGWGGYGIN